MGVAAARFFALCLVAAVSGCGGVKTPTPAPTQSAGDRVAALKPYPVDDWSVRNIDYLGNASSEANQYAATRAICAEVIHAEPPATDLPTREEQAALKGCNSEALYYGIGMAADPAKARQCAMIERSVKRDSPFSFFEAEGILAMVYANGRGAARDYDVALHMACRIEDAPAATDARIKTLAEHRRARSSGADFETCDDNTSGVGAGVCADHAARLAEQSRGERIAGLKRGWAPEARTRFDRTYASLAAYTEIAHDMDCHGGTGHAACAIRGQDTDTERFLARIEALAAGKPMPRDVPSEGVHPATSSKDYDEYYAVADEDEREWLRSNRQKAIDARRVFERDLIAFAGSAFPTLAPHRVRTLFADL